MEKRVALFLRDCYRIVPPTLLMIPRCEVGTTTEPSAFKFDTSNSLALQHLSHLCTEEQTNSLYWSLFCRPFFIYGVISSNSPNKRAKATCDSSSSPVCRKTSTPYCRSAQPSALFSRAYFSETLLDLLRHERGGLGQVHSARLGHERPVKGFVLDLNRHGAPNRDLSLPIHETR